MADRGSSTATPYASSLEHILAELERIDLLIEAQVARARQQHKDDEFQGLYISEQEVDGLIAQPIGLPRWATIPPANAAVDVRTALEKLRTQIDERKRANFARTIPLRLVTLATRFQLSAFDVDALLICLAGEIDLRYERLYSYLQDDVTKKRPSVDLVLNLLCPSFSAKLEARSRFAIGSPLLKYELVAVQEDAANPRAPLLSRYLKLDERIVNYLLGSDEIDSRLLRHASIVHSTQKLEELILPSEMLGGLTALFDAYQQGNRSLNLYLQGPYGVGKRLTAGVLCQQIGLKLLIANVEHLAAAGSDFGLLVRLIAREAVLQEAAVYWHGFDALLADEQRPYLAHLMQCLQQQRGVVFLSGEATWEPADTPDFPPFVRIEFPRPAYAARLQFWANELAHKSPPGIDIAGLANKFRFTGGHIRDAAATARNLARRRAPENVMPSTEDLLEACRLQSNRKLTKLATCIKPHYSWSDIVLPADKLRQLREVCNAVEYRSIVYDEWGFDHKLSLGKGLSLLFAGPSGTGKTMAAEIIARELGLDLYKIDLSTVISKYIGETEKNLSRIFAEAATSNSVLFFDEADALFGKRSEVRDSHDRYANIEINYLLQRMEEHEGTVILATNLRKNMDDAFVRRIQFTIEFPFPNFDQRLAIWQRVWPDHTPRKDLDVEFMARRFEIAGGNIRNIALSAAFLGAEDGGCVEMKHLIRATWQEYQKMGKVMVDGEFGEYRGLLEALS